MRESKIFRVSITLVFLVGVNLASGLLAVAFGYPSLWGNIDVFPEYAYPLPFSWALAHLFSMIPLACVTHSMCAWPDRRIQNLRLRLAAGICVCIGLEFAYGGGRWHGIPFLLFILVDLTAVLVLSCLLTKRALQIASVMAFALVIVVFSFPRLSAFVEVRERRAEFEAIESNDGFVRTVGVSQVANETVYLVEVDESRTGAIGEPTCLDILRVYERMMEVYEPFDDTIPVVRIVRPGSATVVGKAGYPGRGKWRCVFEEPVPPRKDSRQPR